MTGLFVETLLWHVRRWNDETMIEGLEIDRAAGVARITSRSYAEDPPRTEEIPLDHFPQDGD